MRAKHSIAPLERLHDSDETLAASSFFEVFPRLDRQLKGSGQWLDGLHAADVRAGQGLVDPFIFQALGQGLSLAVAVLVQAPKPVIACPLIAVAVFGMPDDVVARDVV